MINTRWDFVYTCREWNIDEIRVLMYTVVYGRVNTIIFTTILKTIPFTILQNPSPCLLSSAHSLKPDLTGLVHFRAAQIWHHLRDVPRA